MAEQERKPTRLWGGRFESGPAEALARLSVSVQFDWRLAPYDLLASAAHARVLHQAELLDDDELARLLAALDSLSRACRNGTPWISMPRMTLSSTVRQGSSKSFCSM